MADHYIVMGDIIGSRHEDGVSLMPQFKALVAGCNRALAQEVESPLTITLGDEFQGVMASLGASVRVLFHLEEQSLRLNLPFRLRYVVHHGQIDSAINPRSAHEMVGLGLTRARELLNFNPPGSPRLKFALPDRWMERQLTRIFRVVDSITDVWQGAESHQIADLLDQPSNNALAQAWKVARSTAWRRRRSGRVEDYRLLKEVVMDLVDREEPAP